MVSIHEVDSTVGTALLSSARNPEADHRTYLHVRLLLVEDDLMVGESIRAGLKKHGFALDWVTTGTAAEAALAAHSHDLVLLDLGLPGKSGIDVLRSLRGA